MRGGRGSKMSVFVHGQGKQLSMQGTPPLWKELVKIRPQSCDIPHLFRLNAPISKM